MAGRRRWVQMARTQRWDPSKHPRAPGGSAIGGRFVSAAQAASARNLWPSEPPSRASGPLGRFVSQRGQQSRNNESDFRALMGFGSSTEFDERMQDSVDPWGDVSDLSPISGIVPNSQQGTVAIPSDVRDIVNANDQLRYTPVPDALPERPASWYEDSWRGWSASHAEQVMTDYRSGTLREHPATVRDLSEGGSLNNGIRRFKLMDRDGNQTAAGIVEKKTHTIEEADAELLASEVGHAIGAPSPVVMQGNDRRTLLMEEVQGTTGYSSTPPTISDGRDVVRRHREGGARLAILDQLTGNRDRHDGNWVDTDDGTPVGIDNGLAWGGAEGPPRSAATIRDKFQRTAMARLNQRVGDWSQMQERISDEELRSWRPRLEALRPAFGVRGRTAWHDHLMDNYDWLLRERDE